MRNLGPLCKKLSELIASPALRRTIAEDYLTNTQLIEFGGSSEVEWHAILMEAVREKRLEEIIRRVIETYSAHEASLRAALKEALVEDADPQGTPLIPLKPVFRARTALVVSGLAVAVLVLGFNFVSCTGHTSTSSPVRHATTRLTPPRRTNATPPTRRDVRPHEERPTEPRRSHRVYPLSVTPHATLARISRTGFKTASVERRGVVTVWNIETRRKLLTIMNTYRGEPVEVLTASFSRDERSLLTTDALGRVTLWSVDGGGREGRVLFVGNANTRAAITPDDRVVVTQGERVLVIDWETRPSRSQSLDFGDDVARIEPSPEGQHFLVFRRDRVVSLYDRGGGELCQWPAQEDTSMSFSSDGESLLQLRDGGRLVTVPLAQVQARCEQIEQERTDGSTAITAMDSASGVLAVAFDTGRVLVGEPSRLEEIAPRGEVSLLKLSPNGVHLLVAVRDGPPRVYNTRTLEVVFEGGESSGDVRSAEFSASGDLLVMATANGVVVSPCESATGLQEKTEADALREECEMKMGQPEFEPIRGACSAIGVEAREIPTMTANERSERTARSRTPRPNRGAQVRQAHALPADQTHASALPSAAPTTEHAAPMHTTRPGPFCASVVRQALQVAIDLGDSFLEEEIRTGIGDERAVMLSEPCRTRVTLAIETACRRAQQSVPDCEFWRRMTRLH